VPARAGDAHPELADGEPLALREADQQVGVALARVAVGQLRQRAVHVVTGKIVADHVGQQAKPNLGVMQCLEFSEAIFRLLCDAADYRKHARHDA